MFNQLLFDTVPQSASFPFLKTAVQYRAMEMRTGKWLHWEKGKKEWQKTEEKGTIYSQKYFQKEATAWDGEIMWFILTNTLASTRSRQTWIEFHSSLTLITGTKCKMVQKKEKIRKENVGRSRIEKWTQTQIHLSCVNVMDMPRFPSSSTYEMKNCWLVSLGRKEDIGRKTCSHGNTALGFIHRIFAEVPPIFGTILEIISVSLSLSAFHRHDEGSIKLAAWWGQHV